MLSRPGMKVKTSRSPDESITDRANLFIAVRSWAIETSSPSIRSKAQRRGLQDHAYFWLLQNVLATKRPQTRW